MVSQDLTRRKEVLSVLLCHHLQCASSSCGLEVVCQGLQTLRANSPVLACGAVLGAQLRVGEGVLLILALMAVNTYLAIC